MGKLNAQQKKDSAAKAAATRAKTKAEKDVAPSTHGLCCGHQHTLVAGGSGGSLFGKRVVVEDHTGKIPPLQIWTQSRLSAAIGRALGYTKFEELPSLSWYGLDFIMSPLCYIFLFDKERITYAHVRHLEKEGPTLASFRASLRLHFPDLLRGVLARVETLFTELANIFLSFGGVLGEEMSDEAMDVMLREAHKIHKVLAALLSEEYANVSNMDAEVKAAFLRSGKYADLRLPVFLSGAIKAAEKVNTEKGKRARIETEGETPHPAGITAPRTVTFFCKSCNKEIAGDANHRLSPEHIENYKKMKSKKP